MATKKETSLKLMADAGIEVSITAEQGAVEDNIDDVVKKTHEILKRCRSTDYLDADRDKAVADRDLLAAVKTQVGAAIKDSKSVYDAPFAVIEAKAKALDIQVAAQARIVESIAAEVESEKSSPQRADVFGYFSSRARWLGPKYGPIVWSKHPTSWDKATDITKVKGQIDDLLIFVRASFCIIHRWGSVFEDLLLMRFCEQSDLKDALGIVYGYKEYLEGVAIVAAGGGDQWDGWTDDLLFCDEERVTEMLSITGTRFEVDAAKAAVAAMGARIDAARQDGIDAISAWMGKQGFDQAQIDEAIADARALAMTLSDVRKLELDPSMTISQIETAFFKGLSDEKGD